MLILGAHSTPYFTSMMESIQNDASRLPGKTIILVADELDAAKPGC
jgi:hypothetical protein